MFSLKKVGRVSTAETSTTEAESSSCTSTSSDSDDCPSLKSKTFNLLRNTRDCVMRQCRPRWRTPSEEPAPPPPTLRNPGYRGVLRQNINKRNVLSELQAKLEAATSQADEVSAPPRTRCTIGRVPRRGVGVALTVRRHFKTDEEDDKDSLEQSGDDTHWYEAPFGSAEESVYSVLPVTSKVKTPYNAKHYELLPDSDIPRKVNGFSSPKEDPIAFQWARALSRLDRRQMKIAKKAINAVLLEAVLGNLDSHSVQINTPVITPMVSKTPFPKSYSNYINTLSQTSANSELTPTPPSSVVSILPSSSTNTCRSTTSCLICSHSTILFRPAECCGRAHTPRRKSTNSLSPCPTLPSPLPCLTTKCSPAPCPCIPAHFPTSTPANTGCTVCDPPFTPLHISPDLPKCMINNSLCPPCSLAAAKPPKPCDCYPTVDKELSACSLPDVMPKVSSSFSPTHIVHCSSCSSQFLSQSPTDGSPCVLSPPDSSVKFTPSSFTCPSNIRTFFPSSSSTSETPNVETTCTGTSPDRRGYKHTDTVEETPPLPKLSSPPPCSGHTLVDYPSPKCCCSRDSQKHFVPCSKSLVRVSPVASPCKHEHVPRKEDVDRWSPPDIHTYIPPKCKQKSPRVRPPPYRVTTPPAASPSGSQTSVQVAVVTPSNNSISSQDSREAPGFSQLDDHIRRVLKFPDVDASSRFNIVCLNRRAHNQTTKDYFQRFNRFIFRGHAIRRKIR